MSETVSCEIVLGDGRPWRGHLPVLRLSWSESDPLAVVVVVGARPAHPALLRGRWVVLRDSLRSVLAPDGGAPGGRPAGHVSMSRQDEHVTLTLRAASLPLRGDRSGRADAASSSRRRTRSSRPAVNPGARPSTPRSRACCTAIEWTTPGSRRHTAPCRFRSRSSRRRYAARQLPVPTIPTRPTLPARLGSPARQRSPAPPTRLRLPRRGRFPRVRPPATASPARLLVPPRRRGSRSARPTPAPARLPRTAALSSASPGAAPPPPYAAPDPDRSGSLPRRGRGRTAVLLRTAARASRTRRPTPAPPPPCAAVRGSCARLHADPGRGAPRGSCGSRRSCRAPGSPPRASRRARGRRAGRPGRAQTAQGGVISAPSSSAVPPTGRTQTASAGASRATSVNGSPAGTMSAPPAVAVSHGRRTRR